MASLTEAACLSAAQSPVSLAHLEVAEPGNHEVIVRMEACGICHSDVMITGLEKLPLTPLVLGHEGIGRVELAPAGSPFAPGDRVGITYLASSCGLCELCRSGRERFCLKQVNHGYTRHGALARYALADTRNLVRVPEQLSAAEAAPLCCAGWTAYGALREAALQPGQFVAIFGMGGLGHLAVQYAKHMGCRVAVVDVSPEKLHFATRLGADVAVTSEDARKTLTREFGGVDAAIVFTAAAAAVPVACSALKRCGSLIVVGLTLDKFALSMTELALKGIRLQGSYLGTRDDLDRVFALAVDGVARPEVHSHPLDQAPELIAKLKQGAVIGRSVIVF